MGSFSLLLRHLINALDEAFIILAFIMIVSVCSAPPARPPWDDPFFLNGNECDTQLQHTVFALCTTSLVLMLVQWIVLFRLYYQSEDDDNISIVGFIALPITLLLLLIIPCISHQKN